MNRRLRNLSEILFHPPFYLETRISDFSDKEIQQKKTCNT